MLRISNIKQYYRVELVEEIAPPEGATSGNWFRYVIGEGDSRLVGKMAGTLESVTIHAIHLAEGFNTRSIGKSTKYISKVREKNNLKS